MEICNTRNSETVLIPQKLKNLGINELLGVKVIAVMGYTGERNQIMATISDQLEMLSLLKWLT